MKNLILFKIFVLLVLINSTICSCSGYKNITYFKNIDTTATIYNKGTIIPVSEYTEIRLLPDDILKVSITTLDPEANGAANITASGNIINSASPVTGLQSAGAKAPDGYLINKDGNIELPLLGQINVGGLTTAEARDKIFQKASVYYKDPTINVRLANFRVTVLGEVAKPGTYNVDGERISVLDALGLSGDLTIYGKRENVMLIRQDGEQNKQVVRMNLNDTKMLSTPFFYMKQGDVLYVEPGKGKAAATDMASTRNYAIAGSIISVLIVLLTRINF